MSILQTKFLDVEFANPLILASGILGVTGHSLKYCVEQGAGGVTSKSVWLNPHKGHPCPTMFANEHYFMNAVGLPDGGLNKAVDELGGYMQDRPAPLIMNIVGGTEQEFYDIAERADEIKPDLIELNLSCPNVESEFGAPFACSTIDTERVTAGVRSRVKTPLLVKLSPNVSNIGEIAKAAEAAGADGITAINTLGPGMEINIEMRAPVLANGVGGVSGPAIKPIAVKRIYDVYKAVKIPILGMGGVTTGRDAIELMMAGASLVGIGSAVYYRGPEVFKLVAEEMREWCEAEGVKNISEIVGAVHK